MISLPVLLNHSDIKGKNDKDLKKDNNQSQTLRVKNGPSFGLSSFYLQHTPADSLAERNTIAGFSNTAKTPPRQNHIDDKTLNTPKTEISISPWNDSPRDNSSREKHHNEDKCIDSFFYSSILSKVLNMDDDTDGSETDEVRIELKDSAELEYIHQSRDIEKNCDTKSEETKPSKFTLKKAEQEALHQRQRHLSLLAFGLLSTLFTITLAIMGLTLSYITKSSSSFVRLNEKLEISSQLNLVEFVGIGQVKLCYNQTSIEHQLWEMNSQSIWGDGVYRQLSGCFNLQLSSEEINDTMWVVSFSFQCLALVMGTFSTTMLLLTIYWESINLKPIVISLLLTYLFQSLSFSFFDSNLCHTNGCEFSEGSICSLFASICWFLCSFSCIRMHIGYETKRIKWNKRRESALRKIDLQRKYSYATEVTSTEDTFSQDLRLET